MRGEYYPRLQKGGSVIGITPTCVGNTTVGQSLEAIIEDHPHMRGEYWDEGKSYQGYLWITPTCVGNTNFIARCQCPVQDHPHMRGEYRVVHDYRKNKLGSPPHAWGILGFQPIQCLGLGITPTCVGNTN
ncbi:hypothetical protein FD47_GL000360 [Lentilactobacillus parafarraginis DSM 18390 = JCM 14109]|uniref:Uncharacterized protein n=1 Tax=Lentilactobacillus parafarraginis DSM 18390 = JCM 14109 TaxID=1423786 RepID=A0A0R1Z0J9_9LACO|nr:hypothetical protein FD47_GL000360 [Lentilactobacillus parafarraginis DSM 18390 = JCM 14109]